MKGKVTMSELEPPTEAEGTVMFRLRHEHPDWTTNEHTYNFQKLSFSGMTVVPIKWPNGTITLEVDGPLGAGFYFKHPIPPSDQYGGLRVRMQWESGSIHLFLNDSLVQTVTPPPPPP